MKVCFQDSSETTKFLVHTVEKTKEICTSLYLYSKLFLLKKLRRKRKSAFDEKILHGRVTFSSRSNKILHTTSTWQPNIHYWEIKQFFDLCNFLRLYLPTVKWTLQSWWKCYAYLISDGNGVSASITKQDMCIYSYIYNIPNALHWNHLISSKLKNLQPAF